VYLGSQFDTISPRVFIPHKITPNEPEHTPKQQGAAQTARRL
jgi:hypothetical protein